MTALGWICLIILVFSLVLWYKKIFSYKGLWNLPGPTIYPFIGQMLELRHMRHMHDIHRNILKLMNRYGPITIIWTLKLKPHVLINNVRVTEYLLSSTKHISKSEDYTLLEPWLGQGLLTSTGNKWHRRRKLLTPAFHFKILEEFTETIHENGKILIGKLGKHLGEDINIYPFIKHYALDVICETAMGTSINAQINEEHTEYIKATNEYLTLIYLKVFSTWEQFTFLYNLFSSGPKKIEKQVNILHKFTRSVIENRRQQLVLDNQQKNIEKSEAIDTTEMEYYMKKSNRKKLAFLDLLLQTIQDDGQPLTDEDIREEVDTFMFEGHDTVTSGMSFIIYELSKHREVQEKILRELEDVLRGDKNVQPTIADLQKMHYLEMVIKEGLRLYPPVPVIERELQEDVLIDNVDFMENKQLFLPKQTTVVLCLQAMHMNEEVYHEPEKFIPERFLKENLINKSPYVYFPFSAGPRNCIGQKFAMLELKATLIELLKNFEILPLQPAHEPIIYNDSILKSGNGLMVRLKRRK